MQHVSASADSRQATAPYGSLSDRFRPVASAFWAASINGLINIIYTVSFSALLFQGVLVESYPLGISTILFSYAICSVVMAAGSSLPGVIATPKGTITAILSIVAVSVVESLSPAADPAEVTASLFTCMLVSALLTGLTFFLLGALRGGNLVRYIPFPVLSGYFGGVGIILFIGSASIMTDRSLSWAELPRMIDFQQVLLWAPGVIFAAACLAGVKRFAHFLAVPLLIGIGVAVFYCLSAVAGFSVADLRTRGYLLPSMDTGITLPNFFPAFISRANWLAVGDQWGHILSIVLIGSISVLLYISLTEVATGEEIDLQRDLKAVGLANMGSAVIGGFISFHEPVETRLAYRLGGNSRWVGIFFGAICLGFVFGGSHAFGYFPKPIMGGLVMFVGADMLTDSLVRGWRRLPKSEFWLVVVIILSITVLGFLAGIGVGILVAAMLFVVNYSRIDVVKSRLSGKFFHSKVQRSPAELQVLRQRGDQVQIFILQGYIFFGTAERLLGRIREAIRKRSGDPQRRITTLVLDFGGVPNIDSSALNAFSKLLTTIEKERIMLAFTDMVDSVESHLDIAGFFDHQRTIRFAGLDYALEWSEERLLKSSVPPNMRSEDIDKQLEVILQHPGMVSRFKSYLERIELGAGEVLFRLDDPSDCLYLIESGRISTLLPGTNGGHLRLRSMGAGTLLGEIGLYTEKSRSADAVADRPSILWALSYERFIQLERAHPEIARQFHKYVVLTISQRMALDSEAMRALAL